MSRSTMGYNSVPLGRVYSSTYREAYGKFLRSGTLLPDGSSSVPFFCLRSFCSFCFLFLVSFVFARARLHFYFGSIQFSVKRKKKKKNSVWLLAVVRLAFTEKIRLTGRELLLCLCWLLFQKLTAVKQAKFGAAKNFYCCAYAKLVCYAIARFLAAWWKFVCRTRLCPIFPKHFVLFVWFYLERRL